MAVLDWFKQKKKQEQPHKKAAQKISVAKTGDTKKQSPKKSAEKNTVLKMSGTHHHVLYAPHVTEKSMMLQEQNHSEVEAKKLAAYDVAVKSGKLEYEEVLLDLALAPK